MQTFIITLALMFALPTLANENRPKKGFDYAKNNKHKTK